MPCADNHGCSNACAVIDGVEQCFCPVGFFLHRFDALLCVGNVLCSSGYISGAGKGCHICSP